MASARSCKGHEPLGSCGSSPPLSTRCRLKGWSHVRYRHQVRCSSLARLPDHSSRTSSRLQQADVEDLRLRWGPSRGLHLGMQVAAAPLPTAPWPPSWRNGRERQTPPSEDLDFHFKSPRSTSFKNVNNDWRPFLLDISSCRSVCIYILAQIWM